MPPYIEFKLCDKFEIKKIICCLQKSENLTEEDFKLIRTKQTRYPRLVPRNHEYIFFKVLDTGEIISVVGKLLPFFKLKSKDLLHKNLTDICKCQPLFAEFIEPLFKSCLEKSSSYQFDFEVKNKKFSCSLYPCYIAEDIASVDIIIRHSHNSLADNTNNDQYILD